MVRKTHHEIDEVIYNRAEHLQGLQGKVDLIVGGPPCQGFSSAGRRREDDIRNGLINSYLKFVELIKPKIIFFENVKGFTLQFLKNKSRGLIYASFVVDQLKMQGYQVFGKLIDFSKYGIPQKRTRFILVGIRSDVANKNKISAKSFFKELTANKKNFLVSKGLPQKPNLGSAISDLLKINGTVISPDRNNFLTGKYSNPKSKYQKYLRNKNDKAIPDSHSFANHKKAIIKRFKYLIKVSTGSKNISKATRQKLLISKHTIIPLAANKKAPTITTLPDDYIHYCGTEDS